MFSKRRLVTLVILLVLLSTVGCASIFQSGSQRRAAQEQPAASPSPAPAAATPTPPQVQQPAKGWCYFDWLPGCGNAPEEQVAQPPAQPQQPAVGQPGWCVFGFGDCPPTIDQLQVDKGKLVYKTSRAQTVTLNGNPNDPDGNKWDPKEDSYPVSQPSEITLVATDQYGRSAEKKLTVTAAQVAQPPAQATPPAGDQVSRIDLDRAKDELKITRFERDEARKSFRETLNVLSQTKDELAKTQALVRNVTQLQTQVDQAKAAQKTAEDKATGLQTQLTNAQTDKAAAEARAKTLEENLKSAQAAMSPEANKVKEEVDKAKAAQKAAEDKVTSLQAQLKTAQDAQKAAEAKATKLEADLKAAQAANPDVARLQALIIELEKLVTAKPAAGGIPISMSCKGDKVATFAEVGGAGPQRQEIGGGGGQHVDFYPDRGIKSISYIVPPQKPYRWMGFGSIWEWNGPECVNFDYVTDASGYARNRLGDDHSGVVIDLRGSAPKLVANVGSLNEQQIKDLLAIHNKNQQPAITLSSFQVSVGVTPAPAPAAGSAAATVCPPAKEKTYLAPTDVTIKGPAVVLPWWNNGVPKFDQKQIRVRLRSGESASFTQMLGKSWEYQDNAACAGGLDKEFANAAGLDEYTVQDLRGQGLAQ